MSAAAEQPEPSEPAKAEPGFKLRRIEIENFKAIDKLTLELPAPLMEDDPDVFVIGSKNGVGKTSVLEACTLLWTSLMYRPLLDDCATSVRYSLRQYLIRAGTHALKIRGVFSGPRSPTPCELVLSQSAPPSVNCELPSALSTGGSLEQAEELLLAPFFGASARPFALFDCMYFHSNRRVAHGPVEIGVALSKRTLGTLGWIKHEILTFLMTQAGLFEDIGAGAVTETARVLEQLFRDFAEVSLSKLRTQRNNTFDIRVQPLHGGESFSLDALSSGQKEMISTLFLIWQQTRNSPSLVLVDEPELHLNAEWQVKFVRLLFKLAPQNQYIFATHSEHIFRSVQEDRRILLGPRG